MRLEEFDTPFLSVDLDAVERNIARLQSYCDEHGFACRPHIKTHKLPKLAHMQLQAGAVGITCQKLGEAEVMAAEGIDDILVSFPLVGRQKVERLAALTRRARVAVVGDSAAVAQGLSKTLRAEGAEVDFLVECDTGFGRTGVQSPQKAAELAQFVHALPGLRFAGLMTYPTTAESGPWLRAARKEVEEGTGLSAKWVSGGGTPSYRQTHEIGEVTEVRCGTYIYGDRACISNGTVHLEDCALRVRVTVVSRPRRDRAFFDGGSKTLTNDPDESGGGGFGLVLEYPEAVVDQLHEEHGFLDVSRCKRGPEVGERLTIIPNHACGTTNVHDEVVVHRGADVVSVWPIAARGKIQ